MSNRRPIISGIGISRIGRHTDWLASELLKEACVEALNDAGLTGADIDGAALLADVPFAEACADLGIQPTYVGASYGRAGVISGVIDSAAAVAAGRARHVIVNRTVKMVGGNIVAMSEGSAPRHTDHPTDASVTTPPAGMIDLPVLVAYNAWGAPNWLAMHMRRHMHLYGTTREQLGWLAVNSRRNAALNDRAIYKNPLTLDDYMNARMISSPFCLLDCDVPVDGAVSLVISHPDYAPDCPNAPISIESTGGSTGIGGWTMRPDYPKMASVDAAAEMWSKTELKVSDVDVAEIYDGFSFLTLAWLEALGVCKTGEGGPFLQGGQRIALDGEFPLNTYGGQLSAGRMHGYWTVHEACLQLRRQAGRRQVQKRQLDVALVSAGGGPIGGCMLLTR